MSEPIKEQPAWLKETQNRSWEPELLITGISLVFIYSITDEVSEFAIYLVQSTYIHPLFVLIASLYLGVALIALKWMFAFHLLFRGIWVGMVGLSYVFPKGINFEKLPKMSRAEYVIKEYDQPVDMVLLLERICSSIFSLAFMVVGVSIFILFFLMLAWFLTLTGLSMLHSMFTVLGLMILLSLPVPLNYLIHLRTKRYNPVLQAIFRVYMQLIKYMFFREPMVTFQTNANQIGSIVFFVLLFGLLGFNTGAFLAPTMDFFDSLTPGGLLSKIKKTEKVQPVRINPLEYRDQTDRMVHEAQIPSFYVEDNFLELFITDYRWDRKVFDKANEDSLMGYTIKPLVNVYLDSSEVIPIRWYRTNHPKTDQLGWITQIKTDSLELGNHILRIDKTTWHYRHEETFMYEKWSEIPFWKK